MIELKPCPFCGGDPKSYKSYFEGEWTVLYWIACIECGGASSYFGTEQEAWDAWNKRTIKDLEKTQLFSVKEKLPEEDGEYLVYANWNDWGNNKGFFSCEFVRGEWMVDANTCDHITHWMPLPKPPEVE